MSNYHPRRWRCEIRKKKQKRSKVMISFKGQRVKYVNTNNDFSFPLFCLFFEFFSST